MPKIWNDLLSLFFPRLCLLCRKSLVDGEEHICLACLCNLPRTRFTDYTDNAVAQLFIGKIPFQSATALFYFEKGGQVQTLIHALKYQDNKELGYYLGRLAARDLTREGETFFTPTGGMPIDVLLPVPLHPRKQRKRGYNQAEWIARGISSVLQLPVDTTSVQRSKWNETQTNKQLYERWENVQDIFTITEPACLQGKHVLLVDDVITSGSTIGSCAETLLAIPDIQVSILGISVTQH